MKFKKLASIVTLGIVCSNMLAFAAYADSNKNNSNLGKKSNDLLMEFDNSQLLCGNRSNQEIADILGVKVATVKTHVIHILQKLGVKRRGEAKEVAQKLHIIEF